jgi:flagellar FliL protein
MAKKEGKDKAEEKEEKKPEEQEDKGEKEGAEAGAEGEGGLAGLGKKRIILAVGVVVLLLVVSVAAAFFGGMMGGDSEEGADADGKKPVVGAPKVAYFEMDEFLVNLNVSGKQQSFLKMKVTLELPDAETKAMVEAKMPRIRDMFQIYLRELRTSDLQGSAGLQRLREELLLRINKILHPLKANDILFKEIIVQ